MQHACNTAGIALPLTTLTIPIPTMPIWKLSDRKVQCDDSVWIAPGAHIIGDVRLASHVSVWFNAVIRADNEAMHIGARTNVQDGAVLHSDPGFALQIGQDVTIGHQAMLHGCTVGDGTLIGIGSIVLNGAVIGKNCLVAAGAVVKEGAVFEDNTLIVGAPAVAKKQLSPEAIEHLQANAKHYVAHGAHYAQMLQEQSNIRAH